MPGGHPRDGSRPPLPLLSSLVSQYPRLEDHMVTRRFLAATLLVTIAACSSSNSGGSGGSGSGGTSSQGGASGGTTSSGGQSGTGGSPSTGGSTATGGSGSGGQSGTGGSPSTGGSTATGGSGSGGQPSTGGATGSGGSTARGATGGTTAAQSGGASGSGGRSGLVGAPEAVALRLAVAPEAVALRLAVAPEAVALRLAVAPAPGDPVPSSGCGKATSLKGESKTTINVTEAGAGNREYYLRLPDDYDPNHPYALWFAIHCLNGSAENVAHSEPDNRANYEYFGMWKLANPAGGKATTIFVAPQGINAGWGQGAKDLAFFRAMMTKFESELCIDTSRIFASGFSMGGSMSYALACAMPDKMRAIAMYSGGSMSGCDQSKRGPVSIFISHGTEDGTCTWPGSGVPQINDLATAMWLPDRRSCCRVQTHQSHGSRLCRLTRVAIRAMPQRHVFSRALTLGRRGPRGPMARMILGCPRNIGTSSSSSIRPSARRPRLAPTTRYRGVSSSRRWVLMACTRSALFCFVATLSASCSY